MKFIKNSTDSPAQVLAQHGVQVDLLDKDLQALHSDQAALFVFNSIDAQLDHHLAAFILSRIKSNYQVLDPLLSIMVENPLLTEQEESPLKRKRIRKYLLNKINGGVNLGYVLTPPGGLGHLLTWVTERRLLRVVKNLTLPLIPVSINHHPDKPQWMQIRFGNPLNATHYRQLKKVGRLRRFLQVKIKALNSSLEVLSFFDPLEKNAGRDNPATIRPPVDKALLQKDIEALSSYHLLTSRGKYDVYTAKAHEIPHLMQEIGRLRELTFRDVGEGTGLAVDSDEYDLYYHQLFIWERDACSVIGGYRIGYGAEVFRQFGPEGLYISNLLKINKRFYPYMEQAAELGRSFVITSCQKQPLPLFLLWKGILCFLLRHPDIRYLYGPVSISKYISTVSKSVIVAFIKKHLFDYNLSKYLTPRIPFNPNLEEKELQMILQNLPDDISALDHFLAEIEPTHIKVPVLIKQYARQNARFICFNLDPHFSDALDGFMLLDLHNLPPDTIETLKKEK